MTRSGCIFGIFFLHFIGQGCVPSTQRGHLQLDDLPAQLALGINKEQPEPPKNEVEKNCDKLLEPWWNHWNDDLNARLLILRQNNLKLLNQDQQLEILRLQANIVGASGQPEIFGTAKWTETQVGGKQSTDKSTHSPTLGFLASWELDLWGKLKSQRETARLKVEWSEWQRHQLQLSLEAELVKTWVRTIALSEDRLLLQRQLAEQKKLLDSTEARFRQGLSTAQECWQQRETTFALQKNFAPLEPRQQVLEQALQILMGSDLRQAPTSLLLDKLPPLNEPFPETLPSQVLANHPKVKMAWNKLLQADENVVQKITQRWPTLSLSGSLLLTATQPEDVFQNWINQLTANLLMPLFDAGQRKSNVNVAKTQFKIALLEYTEAVRQTYVEICQALGQFQQIKKQLHWLTLEQNARQEVLKEAEKRYPMGQESATNVWRFRQSLYQIEREALSLNAERLISLVAIQQSLGPPPPPQTMPSQE